MNHESPTADDSSDLDAARRDVARAEARLSNRWRAAKAAGEKSVGRAMTVAKPVLIGAAVVGGVIWLASSLSRRHRGSPRRYASIPTQRSLAADVARAAALALASTAARRLAERYLAIPGASDGYSSGSKLHGQATG